VTGDDSLSIFAAARDAGNAAGLAIGAGTYTFAELAALAQGRIAQITHDARASAAFPLVGSNTLETVVTLYALLETRLPALLVHPQLTEVNACGCWRRGSGRRSRIPMRRRSCIPPEPRGNRVARC
jgi:hypothetical protein